MRGTEIANKSPPTPLQPGSSGVLRRVSGAEWFSVHVGACGQQLTPVGKLRSRNNFPRQKVPRKDKLSLGRKEQNSEKGYREVFFE